MTTRFKAGRIVSIWDRDVGSWIEAAATGQKTLGALLAFQIAEALLRTKTQPNERAFAKITVCPEDAGGNAGVYYIMQSGPGAQPTSEWFPEGTTPTWDWRPGAKSPSSEAGAPVDTPSNRPLVLSRDEPGAGRIDVAAPLRVQADLALWNRQHPGDCDPKDYGSADELMGLWTPRSARALASFQRWYNHRKTASVLREDGAVDADSVAALEAEVLSVMSDHPDDTGAAAGDPAAALKTLLAQINRRWPNRTLGRQDGIQVERGRYALAISADGEPHVGAKLPPLAALATVLAADPRFDKADVLEPSFWNSNDMRYLRLFTREGPPSEDPGPWSLTVSGDTGAPMDIPSQRAATPRTGDTGGPDTAWGGTVSDPVDFRDGAVVSVWRRTEQRWVDIVRTRRSTRGALLARALADGLLDVLVTADRAPGFAQVVQHDPSDPGVYYAVCTGPGTPPTGQWFPAGAAPVWPNWALLLAELPPQRRGGYADDGATFKDGCVVLQWNRGEQRWEDLVETARGKEGGEIAANVAAFLVAEAVAKDQGPAGAVVVNRGPRANPGAYFVACGGPGKKPKSEWLPEGMAPNWSRLLRDTGTSSDTGDLDQLLGALGDTLDRSKQVQRDYLRTTWVRDTALGRFLRLEESDTPAPVLSPHRGTSQPLVLVPEASGRGADAGGPASGDPQSASVRTDPFRRLGDLRNLGAGDDAGALTDSGEPQWTMIMPEWRPMLARGTPITRQNLASVRQRFGLWNVSDARMLTARVTPSGVGWFVDPNRPEKGATYAFSEEPLLTPSGKRHGEIVGFPANPSDWSAGVWSADGNTILDADGNSSPSSDASGLDADAGASEAAAPSAHTDPFRGLRGLRGRAPS